MANHNWKETGAILTLSTHALIRTLCLGKTKKMAHVHGMSTVSDYSQSLDKLRDNCPVRAALDVIRGRWKPLILFELHQGTKRFTELRAALPDVTSQTLTLQLRQLEADEIITRTIFQEIPIRVEYELSAYGQTLSKVMEELEAWGKVYLQRQRRNKARQASTHS
jgi:DNA-binding HxlR family transcriptional regulator